MKKNLLFSLTALLVLSSVNAQAATYYVGTTGNDNNSGTSAAPFRTIAKGIATAATDGDTVTLANGTYNESNLNFGNKNLTLKSTSGAPASCILDCQQLGPGISIAGNQTATSIQGLTIRNAFSASNHTAGGLYISQSAALISNCVFTSCRFNYSGVGLGGDAIYLDHLAQATIIGCTFSGNGGGSSTGALVFSGAGPFALSGCTFTGSGSGAVGILGASGSMIDCTISGNSNVTGGAGLYLGGGTVLMNRCMITGNHSNNNDGNYFGGGGGVWIEAGDLTLTSCLIAGNTSTTGHTIGNPHQRFNSQILLESYDTPLALQAVNCTFVAPDTGDARGNIIVNNILFPDGRKNVIVTNSILRGAYQIDDISEASASQLSVSNSILSSDPDPKFVNSGAGNYRLQTTSPCINKGSAAAPGLPSTDLDGGPRILGNAPDQGAYELWTSTSGAWFVDKAAGNDADAGSPSAPFKTVVKAIAAASASQKIYIKQGAYSTDKPRITKKLQLFNWQDTGAARVGKS